MTIGSGSESQVNSTTRGDHTAPRGIPLAGGGYAVVWTTPTGWSLQRFSSDGAAIGGEVALPDPVVPADGTHYFTGNPVGLDYTGPIDFDIVELPDGSFLYAYSVNVGYLSYTNYHQMVYTGIVGDDGTVVRPAVWTLFAGGDGSLELRLLSDGGALIRCHFMLFDLDIATGRMLTHGHLYSTSWVGTSDWNLVDGPEGTFLATWHDEDEGTQALYGTAAGNLTGPRLELPIPRGAAIVHGDGVLYFAWIEEDENGDPKVAVGTTDGTSFDAWWTDRAGTEPSDVGLWQLADGRLLVTWTASSQGDGDGKTVMAQLVAEGLPIGDVFTINSNTAGDQSGLSIVALEDGRFVATWQTPDGDGFGIASRAFDPKSLTGTGDGDLLIGGAFDDTIVAGGGSDTVDGGAGDDSIDAGADSDIIYGSAGNDTIEGGDGSDAYLVGGTWADWIFEEVGDGSVRIRWHDDPDYGIKTLLNVESIRFGDDSEMAIDSIPSNRAPAATADNNASDAVIEVLDTTARGNVIGNDSDPDVTLGDRVKVISAGFASNTAVAVDADGATIVGKYGTLTLQTDGAYLYTLDSSSTLVQALRTGDVRTEEFAYTISDTKGGTASATLTIMLSGRDSGPRTVADSVSATEDATKVISFASLLANDTHPEGRAFQLVSIQGAQHGSVTTAGSSVVFTPDADYTGAASFTYTVRDSAGHESAGLATLDIAPVNDAPVVTTNFLWGYMNQSGSYSAADILADDIDKDGDALTLTAVSSAVHGTAVLDNDGRITFTPEADYKGWGASFSYTISDGNGGTATGLAVVLVDGPNRAPIAKDDTAYVSGSYGVLESWTLLANDTDADGDWLWIASVGDAVGGHVVLVDGKPNFSFDEGFTGIASFTYTSTDGYTVSAPATVHVEVAPYVPITSPPTVPPIELPTTGTPITSPPTVHTPIELPTTWTPITELPPHTPIELPTTGTTITMPSFPPIILHPRTLGGTRLDERIDKTHGAAMGGVTSNDAEDIYAGYGRDTVRAGGGGDILRGEGDSDSLFGEKGQDTLMGGAGMDTLNGGGQADAFVFAGKLGKSSVDTIRDFAHDIDMIQLDHRSFAAIGPSLEAKEFHAAAGATKAHDRSDRIVYDTKTGKLYYDDDGNKAGGHAPVHFATLSNKPVLDHGDFAIV